jgi:alkylhydroperoxidase family enzyme
MARIDVPAGDGPEQVRVWALHPKMAMGVAALSNAVYEETVLAPRVREVVRMRVARINDCPN